MSGSLIYCSNRHYGENDELANTLLSEFFEQKAEEVFEFHQSMPGYEPTPLVNLKALSSKLGVGEILVKDESKRFGLNAFKVLGSSYALASQFQG